MLKKALRRQVVAGPVVVDLRKILFSEQNAPMSGGSVSMRSYSRGKLSVLCKNIVATLQLSLRRRCGRRYGGRLSAVEKAGGRRGVESANLFAH